MSVAGRSGGRMFSEEDAQLYREKDARLVELEAELEERQRRLFESMQGVTQGDLNLRVQHTLFRGQLPSDVVLPENAQLGRMAQDLEQQLVTRTAEVERLRGKLEGLGSVQEVYTLKQQQIMWLEHANLLGGLPFLSKFGSLSGLHGPWPKEVQLSKKKRDVHGNIVTTRPKRNADGSWDVNRGDQDGVIRVNGINMPVQGYTSIDELEVDPRTGLKIVPVPPDHEVPFCDVVDTVIYFFAMVRTRTGQGKRHLHKRILIISDQSLYICGLDGTIRRCIDIMDLVDCMLDDRTGVGLKVEAEHDLLMQCMSVAHRDLVIDCIIKVQAYVNEGLHKRMIIRQLALNQRIDTKLVLQKQPDWQFKLMPLRTKAELMKEINEKLV
eukprot:TRINITY_DN27611_c0_g1_i2.p2 TRINITY_DN27611_c0_g1~~TRINITY_DN27611_c0_g1_i2.p2  ORF type:complete len:403 (+),score=171.06 TRINITY_DN27611_c0_g1_i2:66-1211(+)